MTPDQDETSQSNNPFDQSQEQNENLLLDLNELNQQNQLPPDPDAVPPTEEPHYTTETNVGSVDQPQNSHNDPTSAPDQNSSTSALNFNVLSARSRTSAAHDAQLEEDYNSWDDENSSQEGKEQSSTRKSPAASEQPHPTKKHINLLDDDTDSDEDEDDLFNIDAILSKRKPVSQKITPFLHKIKQSVTQSQKQQEQYETLFDDDELEKDEQLNMEAIEIQDIDENLVQEEERKQRDIDEKLKVQQAVDADAEENLEELRNFERHTKENIAINRVKKMHDALSKEEKRTEKLRRLNYREMSDAARYYFKKKEDLVKMKLERMHAFMKPSQTQMDIHKKQWTLEWDREPQLLDIRMCQIRSVKDTLPEGKYLMLVSLWNRIGGYPMQFTKHVTKVKKSTSEIYHGGQYDDVSMVFDEVLRMSGPSVAQITPRMVFVFELLCLSRGSGDQHLRVNKTVAWGVFPAVDNNLKLIQGCFKCPMIKGDIDLSIDKHSQIQRITRKNIKYWLGNFYFEVKHSGVDRVIRKPEEYVLEVLHQGEGSDAHAAAEAKAQEVANLSSLNLTKKTVSYRGPLAKIRKNIPIIQGFGQKKKISEDAAQFFKSNSRKDQVLTMEQPKIWFGNPQFSVLSEMEEKPRLLETEDDITMTELETEEAPDLSDDEEADLLEQTSGDDAPDFENKPLLNMKRQAEGKPGSPSLSLKSGGTPTGGLPLKSGRKPSLRLRNLNQVSGPPNVRSPYHQAAMSSRFGNASARPWSNVPSSRGSPAAGFSGNNAMNHSFASKPDGDTPIFGKDEELLMFGHQDDDMYSSRSASGYGGTPASGLYTTNTAPTNADAPQQLQNIEVETDTETELEDNPVNPYEQYYNTQENTVKTVKDIQRVYNSLFSGIFELGGASRMDLNFYKQSVKRKKHTWGGTPIYLEKLLYLRRSVLIDMGLSQWKSFEFLLMIIFIFLILLLRAYPHYLGHWIYLSVLRIPINTSAESNFYHIAYSFRGEFRTSATNFGYVVSGMLFNMFLSCCLFLFTGFAQKLYSGLPTLIYRFVFLYGFATILDPLLIAAVGAAFQDWETDMFRLAEYFLLTEESTVPGVLITVALVVPLMILQTIILYQYTLRIHMNCRILDVYKRLHTPEKSLFLPHDLEVPASQFRTICEKSKTWRGPDGHTRLVVVTEIPLDRADYIMLKRLDVMLSCKRWPSDYLKQVMEDEQDMYSEHHMTQIPLEILASKTRPAVFLRNNQFGKMFSIVNFPVMADAILFDTFNKRDQRWRLLRLERLLVDYRIIGRLLVKRLRDGKVITGHLITPELARADYDIFSSRDVEVQIPQDKPIPTTGIKSIPYRIQAQARKAYEYVSSAVYHAIHKDEEEEIFYGDLEMNEFENADGDDANAEMDYRTVCKHIQVYNVSLTRDKTLYRHFIRCPTGSICEVFDKVENQESAAIADIHANDYWVRKARLDSEKRARRRARGNKSSNDMFGLGL